MKHLYILLTYLLVSNCTNQTNPVITNPRKLVIDSLNTIKLAIDSTTIFSSVSIQYTPNKKLLLLTENENILNIFDVKKQELEKKITFQYEGPNSVGQISGFYYNNPDSIFVFSEYDFTIHLCNEKSEVKNKYGPFRIDSPTNPTPKVINFQRMFFTKNKIYFAGSYANLLKQTGNLNPFFEYDIKSNKFNNIGSVPKRLEGKNWETLDELFIDIVPPDSFVLSSSILDSLCIINTNNKHSMCHYANSKFININEIQAFSDSPKNKASNYIERAKYTIGTAKYWGITYDKYRKIYYRFVIYKNTYKKFVLGEYSKAGIVYFDSNFNKLGEIILPDYYYPEMSFVTPDGLYIANEKAYNENDNYIQFDCFILK